MHPTKSKICIAILIALAATLGSRLASAQVNPSAYRSTQSLWVGAEYSNFSASFPYQSSQRLTGIGAFADFKWNGRIGIDGEARFLHFGGYESSTEANYLVGPEIWFLNHGKFQPYAKFLLGDGHIHYPYQIGDASYLALAPGGGTGYRLNRRWSVRAEYEYQYWLNSPNFANQPKHALTPNGLNLGLAYRIFR
jgi:opacity protein-like surface antigen